ncbi:MAG: orotate phosphoribosyltransferase [Betaproteobacteria bacterium]|nr:orotate phosphoribosyltransferase [Betaproteobacteria bacterium]
MNTLSEQFINFTISNQILKFGEFKTKAGRISPYFFNMGLINNGKDLKELGKFYLELINKNKITFDLLFGPAYKGISIVSATAIAFGDANIKFAFNRKEVKDHGEGGQIIGHPIQGDVVIIDDVISAGTAIRESINIIKAHGGNPKAIIVAIDRQEKGQGHESAIQEVKNDFNIDVFPIINLDDVVDFIKKNEELNQYLEKIEDYRSVYGA